MRPPYEWENQASRKKPERKKIRSVPFYSCTHVANRPVHAHVEGASDNRKPNGDLSHVRNGFSKERDVSVIEPVPGVDPKSCLVSDLGASSEAFGLFVLTLLSGSVSKVAGVEFDAVGSNCGGGFDLCREGIDEQAHLMHTRLKQS